VAGNGLIDESEFLQWVGRIQALSQDTSTDDADDITKDLIAAFRVFDRDGNGYITKVYTSCLVIFNPADNGSMFLQNIGNTYQTTRFHNPQNRNLNFH
jgi:hypothetical protein